MENNSIFHKLGYPPNALHESSHSSRERAGEPVWLRLPKSGTRCPVTGLTRSTLNELVLASRQNGYRPPVVSVVVKKRHAIRGIRLISRDSLIAYLASLVTTATAKCDITEVCLVGADGDTEMPPGTSKSEEIK
ncbi:MAG: hypothetical protein HZA93_08825 [Verrucomicrobia bacterium]|nr:hypothetical protein [Verrucomicrobiota bacterium]